MTSARNKPGVAFWATVVVTVALIGYPVSFGPACWVCDRGRISKQVMAWIYKPFIVATFNGPESIRRILRKYAEWGAPPWVPIIAYDPIGDDGHGGFIFPEPIEYDDSMHYGVLEQLRETD
jgi:hypothetical protein